MRIALAFMAAIALVITTAQMAQAARPPASINLVVAGPGEMTVGSLRLRETSFIWETTDYQITLTATRDGSDTEFLGWRGECVRQGTNPTCVVTPSCAGTIISACAVGGQWAMATPAKCLWVGAAFATPGGRPPELVDPCTSPSPGPGDGGATNPGGGSGGSGSGPGSAGSGAGAIAPGVALPGGVVTVRRAPALARVAVRVVPAGVRTRGTAPRGTTRVVQSLALRGNTGVRTAGRCRVQASSGAFTCSAPAQRGTWTVITQARRGPTVLAQSTRLVRVR
jgi:hypothetical protein